MALIWVNEREKSSEAQASPQASRMRSTSALPNSGFSTMGMAALAAHALSAPLGWLIIRMTGVESGRFALH